LDAITRHRLEALGLDATLLETLPLRQRLDRVHRAVLDHLPYENLSDHEACLNEPHDPGRWPRATDRVLRDHRFRGLGGTSFSLAYALRDLLHGVGANAHVCLGRNLVTEHLHAATLVFLGDSTYLFDATLLSPFAVEVRPGSVLEDKLGTVRVEDGGNGTWTVTLEKRTGGPRPTYVLTPTPAPPHRFRQAWVASFDRGRRHPLRLACRRGDAIHRYREHPGALETLTPDGSETRPLARAPIDELHEVFGIHPACLRAWFA
jgi:hypothetical protein